MLAASDEENKIEGRYRKEHWDEPYHHRRTIDTQDDTKWG